MAKDNGIFVRFTDKMLVQIEQVANDGSGKTKQDVIRDAVVAYLDAHAAMKAAATKTLANHLSEPIN